MHLNDGSGEMVVLYFNCDMNGPGDNEKR